MYVLSTHNIKLTNVKETNINKYFMYIFEQSKKRGRWPRTRLGTDRSRLASLKLALWNSEWPRWRCSQTAIRRAEEQDRQRVKAGLPVPGLGKDSQRPPQSPPSSEPETTCSSAPDNSTHKPPSSTLISALTPDTARRDSTACKSPQLSYVWRLSISLIHVPSLLFWSQLKATGGVLDQRFADQNYLKLLVDLNWLSLRKRFCTEMPFLNQRIARCFRHRGL